MPAARATPPALLLCVALASGCGHDAPPHAGDGAVVELIAAEERVQVLSTAVWLRGPSRLGLSAQGPGALVVRVREEGAEEVTLLERRVEHDLRLELSLPGTGARPLALRVAIDAPGFLRSAVALTDPPPAPPPGNRFAGALAGRDVLLVVADSLHAAHLGCYGSERPTTPGLDELAAHGVRFETAYSQSAWTLSSTASLFTSLEQERHGVKLMGQALAAGPDTLAELFRAAGYRTIGLLQNPVVRADSGLGRGFDEYERVGRWPRQTISLLERARALLDRSAGPPLFLYLHLWPPHQPYEPPAPQRGLFTDPDYAGPITGKIADSQAVNDAQLPREHPDVRHLEGLYDGNVRWTDMGVGRLLRGLEADGNLDRIAVLFTSDHGEAFMQHGFQGHNRHVYDEVMRVPLILYAQGSELPEGLVVETPVSTLDLLPSLVELFDLAPPTQRIDGRSLLGLLDAPRSDWQRALRLSSRYKPDLESVKAAVRLGEFKLVSDARGERLYRLPLDPGELEDVSCEHPVRAEALAAELRRWREQARAQGMQAATRELDAESLRLLKGVGYTEGGD